MSEAAPAAAAKPATGLTPAIKVLIGVSVFFAVGLIVVLGAVCGTGKCKSSAASQVAAAPPAHGAYVSGFVFDAATGTTPLAGIRVTSSLGSVVTDASGAYAYLPLLPAGGGSSGVATITVNRCGAATPCNTGYASTTASVSLFTNVRAYSRTVALHALVPVHFNPTTGVVVAASPNSVISVPPVPGANPNANYTLNFAVVAPHMGPGALQSNVPGSVSNSTQLQSMAMFYIELVDASGNPIPGVSPSINLTNTTFANEVVDGAADDLQWWWFNATLGLWVAESDLAPVGGGRRAQAISAADVAAQRAGYWNSDRNIKTACAIVTVVSDATGGPCVGASGTAYGVDGIVSNGVADANGHMCVDGPADVWVWGAPDNFPSTLTVADASASVVFPSNAASCATNYAGCEMKNIVLRVRRPGACPNQPTPSGSVTPPSTPTRTMTPTPTPTRSVTPTPTRSVTATASASLSMGASPSASASPPPPLWAPFGVQTNVSIASLNGWTECFDDSYGDYSGPSLDGILANCSGSLLLLACRVAGSDTLTVAAWAPRSDVLFYTGVSDTPHTANGVGWYYSPDWSWGFAPAGAPINRDSCDVDTNLGDAAQRMCWHTGEGGGGASDTLGAGWSCGVASHIDPDTYTGSAHDSDEYGAAGYERLIYAANPASPSVTATLSRGASPSGTPTPPPATVVWQLAPFQTTCRAACRTLSRTCLPPVGGPPWPNSDAEMAAVAAAAGVNCSVIAEIDCRGLFYGHIGNEEFFTFRLGPSGGGICTWAGADCPLYGGANDCDAPPLFDGRRFCPCLAEGAVISYTPTTTPTPTTTMTPSSISTSTSTSTASASDSPSHTSSMTATPSPSASPSAFTFLDGPFALVGSFNVNDGPMWDTDPPTYSCVEACAYIFGVPRTEWACSTVGDSVNHLAWVSGWGDASHCATDDNYNVGTPVLDTFSVGATYNCGSTDCSFSAYVRDNCNHGSSINYCFQPAPTATATPSASLSVGASPSETASASLTASATQSASSSASATQSASSSASTTRSVSQSASMTGSASVTPSVSPSSSMTATSTASSTTTPSPSSTPAATTASVTASATRTASSTASATTATTTASTTASPSWTPTATPVSISATPSLSVKASRTSTVTAARTRSATPSASKSGTAAATASSSGTAAATPSSSALPTVSSTPTLSRQPTPTSSPQSFSATPSSSPTRPSASMTPTSSATRVSLSATPSGSVTRSHSSSASATPPPTQPASVSSTSSLTAAVTATGTPTVSVTASASASHSPVAIPTNCLAESGTVMAAFNPEPFGAIAGECGASWLYPKRDGSPIGFQWLDALPPGARAVRSAIFAFVPANYDYVRGARELYFNGVRIATYDMSRFPCNVCYGKECPVKIVSLPPELYVVGGVNTISLSVPLTLGGEQVNYPVPEPVSDAFATMSVAGFNAFDLDAPWDAFSVLSVEYIVPSAAACTETPLATLTPPSASRTPSATLSVGASPSTTPSASATPAATVDASCAASRCVGCAAHCSADGTCGEAGAPCDAGFNFVVSAPIYEGCAGGGLCVNARDADSSGPNAAAYQQCWAVSPAGGCLVCADASCAPVMAPGSIDVPQTPTHTPSSSATRPATPTYVT